MTTFDPTEVRKAVAEFIPRRPQKFQDLVPAKDVIVELRQKSGSYRAIAELLTQHCLPTSKTAIAMFCHQILGETVRPRRRPVRKRPLGPLSPNGGPAVAESFSIAESMTLTKSLTILTAVILLPGRAGRASPKSANSIPNETIDSHP